MAEAAMFSVASKLLSTIASPAFEKAYEKACSIWSARDELSKLKRSIETMQAVLLDAEKKQESSVAIKIWMKRVRDVLYDAEDLFDEVATDDMLRKQIKGNKLFKKVRTFASSSLNPIVSDNSIANKVKDIRKRMLEISEDMKTFQFVECPTEGPVYGMRKGQDPGTFVDSKNVIGRDEDEKTILEMLLVESNDVQRDFSVIAIVGIGGMGKTTFAQLIYNHEKIKSFENRWFACISDTSDDKEVLGKIFQAICKRNYGDLTVSDLQTKVKGAIEGKKFFLVLDDVWDNDRGRWQDRLSLLSSGSKGSKIIVTTRSLSVSRAMGAFGTHRLDGLSEINSWDLFKRVVSFTPEQERDSRWTILGKQIVKKCANVPLAIKSIASLLFEKNTIEEWESFRNEELAKLGEGHKDGIMPVLKLSYENLPSNLKHCFAYCALFPKDRWFYKEELIYMWISQGYITLNNEKQTVEDVGHSYFMDLFRRSFFQDLEPAYKGDMMCKMHDLIHDLAQHVAGDETVMLTTSSNKIDGTRHVSAWGYDEDGSLVIPTSLHNVNRLRSFIDRVKIGGGSLNSEKRFQFANFKLLRALSLPYWNIENVPSYIGELKYLRYLDLSNSEFKNLPDSITKLVNLCTLNISRCSYLKALPNDFRRLINLRHLINNVCSSMMHMPPGFEELTTLQRLDEFKVGRGTIGGQRSRLDVLPSLELKEQVKILFGDETDDWDGVECWQPPLTLQGLKIYGYRGMRIPQWSNGPSTLPKLTHLHFSECSGVKCLPQLRHIPNLNHLELSYMQELEYIQGEEEDDGKKSLKVATDYNSVFLPHLKKLDLEFLPKLKGWWRKVEVTTRGKDEDVGASQDQELPSSHLFSFPSLSHLTINNCREFNHMLLCPQLRSATLKRVNMKMIQQLLSTRDNSSPSTTSSSSSSSSSSSLESVTISVCDELSSFPGESLTSLQRLCISHCNKLKEVHLAPLHLNILEELELWDCRELELWEEKKRGVDWDSLPNLRKLELIYIPSPKMLPNCIRLRQELGKLKIKSLN